MERLSWRTVCLVALLLISCQAPPPPPPPPLGSTFDVAVLANIEDAAEKKDASKLKLFIYNFTQSGFSSQDALINGINQQISEGDFAYSKDSWDKLTSRYLSRIQPISQVSLKNFFLDQDALFFQDKLLHDLAVQSPSSIFMLDEDVTQIIFVKVDQTWKLLYSVNLTKLR